MLHTYPLQELNDGFLVLLCSAVQVLQPELQLSPRVLEHTCVPENLLAVEPCGGQNRTTFCAAAQVSNQRARVEVQQLVSQDGDHSMPHWGQHGSFLLCTLFSFLSS